MRGSGLAWHKHNWLTLSEAIAQVSPRWRRGYAASLRTSLPLSRSYRLAEATGEVAADFVPSGGFSSAGTRADQSIRR
jgi:hypothetical protein